MGQNPVVRRLAGAGLTVSLVVAGASACNADDGKGDRAGATAAATATDVTRPGPATGSAPSPTPTPTVAAFGAAGYRSLTPGMAKEAALATGGLEPAPVSLLDGCTDFAYRGGPAPDAARMAGEAAAEAKAKELNDKADASRKPPASGRSLPPNASAQEAAAAAAGSAASAKQSAADAKAMADSAMATAQLMVAREARDKAFLTVGRVSFGAAGLRELVAPAEARTAEGIGAGSTVEALQQAYGDKGLNLAKNGKYQLPADPDRPGWQLEFTVDGDKVGGLALVNRAVKCV
ncbi:hypothetical protein AB0I39_15200 [Kitasatospora purpeofusca]|uniref:hypothetical protein n=1 Tax=Kitasatospora purpeofusca TaxID=67352 RepID=UPI003400A7A8